MPPQAECFEDGKELLIMGVVVELRSGESSRTECNWENLIILTTDGDDAGDCIVQSVRLDDDQSIRNPMRKDRSGGEGFLQEFEGGSTVVGEYPRSTLAG